jgi:hypothetical protein
MPSVCKISLRSEVPDSFSFRTSSTTTSLPVVFNRVVGCRICSMGRQDEAASGIYDIFVLMPEKGEIVYWFGQVRLKDGNTSNHSARKNGLVGSIVSVTD